MAEVKAQTVPETAAPVTPTSSEVVPADGGGSKKWLWIAGIVVAVVVVAGLLFWLL